MHSVGWGAYEYIRKIMKLHTVDCSVNYHVAVGKEDLFLFETETNGHSMILKLTRVLCVYLPRKNDEYEFFHMRRNFVCHENYYAVNFLYFLDVNSTRFHITSFRLV